MKFSSNVSSQSIETSSICRFGYWLSRADTSLLIKKQPLYLLYSAHVRGDSRVHLNLEFLTRALHYYETFKMCSNPVHLEFLGQIDAEKFC